VIVFQSNATNLVAGDTNGVQDVFVHDLKTGTTARVSVDSVGMQGNGPSGFPALSAKGRVVAFESFADNLVAGDTNGALDVFVHNLKTGITKRVSVDSAGRQSNLDSIEPVLSANGQVVAFLVVSRQLGAIADIFVHDLTTGATEQVSTDSAGTPGNDSSFGPLLSADGRVVAFESAATNLVVGDTNGVRDIFVHDRK
jgi:Tol biopolymer transport system component